MTEKEKANDLYVKYAVMWHASTNDVIKCALIVVDEVMQSLSALPYGMDYLSKIDYWEGVKQELEKNLKEDKQ